MVAAMKCSPDSTSSSYDGRLEEALLGQTQPHRRRTPSSGQISELDSWGASGTRARLLSSPNSNVGDALKADVSSPMWSRRVHPDRATSLDVKTGPPSDLVQPAGGLIGEANTGDTNGFADALAKVPGLLIGTTINIMLCVPFGLAFFPATWEPFPLPRAIGLQMFLVSTLIGQVAMTVGSDFSCSMGMMMVENIPFMHSIARSIIEVQGIGLDAMSTTITAFAISTILMGICFMALGQYQLGKAVSYFPRHFLIGCIGGIGIFVTQTGFEVSTGVPWSWTWMSLERYGSQELFYLWLVAAVLVLILNIALRFIRWSLFPPFFFVGIIPVFYLALLTLGISPDVARENSWLFEHPPMTDVLILWTSFDFSSVRWDLILAQTPTMVALTLFGLMHAPINIPSLSMSTGTEVDMNQELIVHGWSNILSGCLGGLPNYLCYSNSLLYYKCGGGGRLSGFVLCTILLAAIVAGPGAIAYVPRCMAGCLLIHVGLELSKEALVDSLEAFDTFEYTSVLLITIVMTTMGMTAGLGFGLVLSAVSFTLQHMRHCDPIRGVMPAATLRSSFRRTREERDLLYESLRHARVVQLQGTLFFGNATVLSSCCEEMLAASDGDIHVLVLDFTLVRSLESSAAETIAKISTVTRRHGAVLIYNRGSTEGFPTSSPLSDSLSKLISQSGNANDSSPDLHISDDLDDALAWTEDFFLTKARSQGLLPCRPPVLAEEDGHDAEALPLALQQLRALCPSEDTDVAVRLLAHMERRTIPSGTILWRQGDPSTFCMLLSEGLLQNRLEEEAGTAEDCRPGCLVGEYHFINKERRMGTLSAKENSIVYALGASEFEAMLKEDPYAGFVLARVSIHYLGLRCHNVANRIWDTRCLPI